MVDFHSHILPKIDDGSSSVEESVKMVDAVNAAGGNAKLTVYPDCKHEAWVRAYSDYSLFEWLLRHTK